ncbi:MAG: MMPL family transporter [Myxococcales bacterium]|nr:MAG: MMPL family transporter [Myxococcales bacterium]
MTHSNTNRQSQRASTWNDRSTFALYRFRWPLAALTLALVVVALSAGVTSLRGFSDRVTALDETPAESSPPRLFDPRTDIWFDSEDSGLRAYYAIEDQFIAEDLVSIAFEERDEAWGVFSVKSLSTIAELSHAIERIPNVRNVRSLTTNPWIRWGHISADEEGLLIGDLFERAPETYSEEERLERMIAVLGAQGAASVVGEDSVRALIGQDASFSDYIGEPRLTGAVVSEDGRSAALLVQILRPRASPERVVTAFADDPAGGEVGPTIRVMEKQRDALAAIEEVLTAEDRYEFHIAGLPLFEREFLRVGQSDMAFVGLMFAVIAVVLLLIYRRVSAVVVPLLVVFASVIGMMGTVWAAGDLINNLTAIAPVMITAIGVADAVHLVTAYFLIRHRHRRRDELIREVLRSNSLPVFLTSITTSVGFFSLVTSELLPIRQLGYTAGIGTIFAYVLSITTVPALLSLLPLPKNRTRVAPVDAEPSKADVFRAHLAGRWSRWISARRMVIAVASTGVAIVTAVGLGKLEIASDIRLMFPQDNTIIRDLHWTEARIGGGSDLDIVFYAPETNPEPTDEAHRVAASERFLSQVDAFQRRVEEEARQADSPLWVLTNFDSALAVLRKIHQVQNHNAAADYRVPAEHDIPEEARRPKQLYDDVLEETITIPGQDASTLIAQYYIQYENGAKPSENLSSLVSADRRGFRIAARTRTAPSSTLLAAFARLREILATEFPELAGSPEELARGDALTSVMFSGKQYLFTNMFRRFSNTLIVSLALALSVITALIGLVFRSARIAAVSLIPNVLPLLIPLGAMGLLDIPLDGPAVLVVTVALGVCVDDAIHFLTKYTKNRKRGLGVVESFQATFEQVGAALTWTTVILTLGFTVLAFSNFRPNMLIGVLGATMIALAWVADLLVMPAFLSLLENEREPVRTTATDLAGVPAE